MRYKELVTMTPEQLDSKQRELELELMKERAQVASGTAPKNPGLLRSRRRDLARIKTIRNS